MTSLHMRYNRTHGHRKKSPSKKSIRGKHAINKDARKSKNAANNLEYAWVDTCSIDKSSSAELSEAINPMFQWYKDAHYLANVKGSYRKDTKTTLLTHTPDGNPSRWYTRGWILQELLAPLKVGYCL